MAIKVQGNIVIDDSQNIINIGVATIGSIDVNKISPDGSDFGTSSYVPVADGSGTWSWQPVTSAGAGVLDGIIIKEENGTVGTAGSITTLNFVGNNITATAVSGGAIATITASDTPTFDTLGIGTRIDLIPYDTIDNGTLSFEGSAGQLFSITNNLSSGSIFSVNDVSGIPSIDVDADGTIQLAPYGSTEYVGIGTTNPTAKLDINGTLNVTGISTFQSHVYLGTDDKIILGDSGSLEIFSGGSNSIIDQVGSGDLILRTTSPGDDIILRATDDVFIQVAGSENAITCNSNASVDLYYNNTKKFETTADGILVNPNVGLGTTAGNADATQDLAVFQTTNSNTSKLRIVEERDANGTDWNTAYTRIQKTIDVTNQAYIQFNGNGLGYGMQFGSATDNELFAKFVRGGAVELYHDGSKKFETTSYGVYVTGAGNTSTIGGAANLVLDPSTVGDNTGTVTILGNLQVDGTQTVINSTTMTVDDLNITLASGAGNNSAANGAGITVDGASATLTYFSTPDSWEFNKDLILDTTDATLKIKAGGVGTRGGVDFTFNTDSTVYGSLEIDYDRRASEGLWLNTGSYPVTIEASSAHYIKFRSGTTEHMRIESGGDVGIGTDDPQKKLHVYGEVMSGGNISGSYVINLNPSASGPILEFGDVADPDEFMTLGAYSGRNNLAIANRDFRISSTSVTNLVYIADDTGYVGIGTDAPSQKLHVKGAIQLDGTTTAINDNYSRIYQNSSGSVDYGLQLKHYQGDTGDADASILIGGDGSTREGNITFYRDVSGTFTETARFDENGRLGIGTNSPIHNIDVYKTSNDAVIRTKTTAAGAYFDADSNTEYYGVRLIEAGTVNWFVGSYGSSNLQIKDGSQNGGTEVVTIENATGNVGIGTDNPGVAKLDVYGGSAFVRNIGGSSAIEVGSGQNSNQYAYIDFIGDTTYTDYGLRLIRNNGGANTNSALEHRGTGRLYINAQDAGSIALRTQSTDRIVIDSAGDVGIGTDDPIYKLDVRGDIHFYNNAIIASNAGSSNIDHFWHSDSGSYGQGGVWNFVSDSTYKATGNSAIRAGAFANMNDTGTASQKLQISGGGYISGNLGVGATNPQNKLRVYGNAWIDNASGDGQSRANGLTVSNVPNSDWTPGTDVNDSRRNTTFASKGSTRAVAVSWRNIDDTPNAFWDFVADGNTNKFYIQQGGAYQPTFTWDTNHQVAIGTDVQSGSTLAVGGTITELYNGSYWNVVTQADVGYGASQVPLNQYLGQLAFLDDHHPNGLRRDGGGSDDVFVNSSGDVGIGQTDPSSHLHIGPYNGNDTPHLYLASGNNSYGWRFDTQDFGAGSVPLRIFRRVGGTDTEVITVLNQSGNLGIGVTIPSEKLHVSGKVKIDNGNADALDVSNGNIIGINYLSFNDPGPGEGIKWLGGGSGWEIYESPNDLTTNSAGNLQFVDSGVRIFTLDTSGNGEFTGNVKIDSGPTLEHGGSTELRITTNHGYVNIGPKNTSYSHFETDRTRFYFNKKIVVDEGIISSYDEDLVFQTSQQTGGAERVRILTSNGYVGINTTTPQYQLEVNGSFAATTKSFVIDHPTKDGMKLRYGSLEGPENGVYVRGRLKGNDTIELPDHWTGLVDEETITVNLTPIGRKAPLHSVVNVADNTVIVESANDVVDCFYTVFGERKDVEKLEVEF